MQSLSPPPPSSSPHRVDVRWTLLAPLVLAAFACANQPTFTYYDDTAEASPPRHDASTPAPEASTADSTVGDEPSPLAGDTSDGRTDGDDGGALGAADGAADALAEVGCGSLLDPMNCGACGVVCDTDHSLDAGCAATASADAGDAAPADAAPILAACTYQSCATGFADCDAAGANVNGCETPITTLSNCGACGVACNTANSVDAGCGASGCTYQCAPGFADCDAAGANVNGCETPTSTVSNCGACGVTCNTTHSVDAGCGPTGCTYQCAPGWSDCNTTAAPANGGGCECNTPVCCAATGATPSGGGPNYQCATTHSDGVGQPYADCQPVGTYTEAQAMAACTAYVASLGLPATDCVTPAGCTYVIAGIRATTTYQAVFYLNATTDQGYVWVYAGTSGTTTGDVYPASTFCGTRAGPVAWN